MNLFRIFRIAILVFVSSHGTFAEENPNLLPDKTMGSIKAPITIDEYYSLDCPHCAAFENDTLPQLKRNYIDTGKVKLIFHEFPISEIALRAAMLARCAPPEQYFAVVDVLFHLQKIWLQDSTANSVEALKQQVQLAGMSGAAANKCLDDRSLENALLKNRLDAEKSIDIEVTPTFIFNGNTDDRFDGAAPYDVFLEKIEELLKDHH